MIECFDNPRECKGCAEIPRQEMKGELPTHQFLHFVTIQPKLGAEARRELPLAVLLENVQEGQIPRLFAKLQHRDQIASVPRQTMDYPPALHLFLWESTRV